jgi:hypothetical protein
MQCLCSFTIPCLAAAISVAIPTMAGAAQNGGFVFDARQVVSASDKQRFVRLAERLPVAALKRRFPSYSVRVIHEDCVLCAVVSGKDGTIRVDYGVNSDWIIHGIYSAERNARDSLGNAVGTPLSKAVGADTAICDRGEATVCESARVKGLSYVVDETAKCALQEDAKTKRFTIPGCATVDGFQISIP